jgi:hypothetical protein
MYTYIGYSPVSCILIQCFFLQFFINLAVAPQLENVHCTVVRNAYTCLPSVISSYKSHYLYTPTIIFANPGLREKDEFFIFCRIKNVWYTCSYCNSTQFRKRRCAEQWSTHGHFLLILKGLFQKMTLAFDDTAGNI